MNKADPLIRTSLAIEQLLDRHSKEVSSKLLNGLSAGCAMQLRQLHRDHPGASSFARAMSNLEFELWALSVVHHGTADISKRKLGMVESLTGTMMARRQYWIELDRVRFFARGWIAAAGTCK